MALNKQALSGIAPCDPTSNWSDMSSRGMTPVSMSETVITSLVVYVDNLLVFGTKQRITKEKKELARNFEMHDLGKARWFLAMEITRDRVARCRRDNKPPHESFVESDSRARMSYHNHPKYRLHSIT